MLQAPQQKKLLVVLGYEPLRLFSDRSVTYAQENDKKGMTRIKRRKKTRKRKKNNDDNKDGSGNIK